MTKRTRQRVVSSSDGEKRPSTTERAGLLDRLLFRHWRILDEEAKSVVAPPWRALAVLIAVSVGLTLQSYYGDEKTFHRLFADERKALGDYYQLAWFGWWTAWRVIGYVLVPLIAIMLMPGERIRDYHFSCKNFGKHLWIYGVLLGLILPVVFIASKTDSFQHTYPFYKLSNRSTTDFLLWELFYAIQFLSLEIFFRGFMLNGLRELGARAIFVMTVPYCMIHFGKPIPETIGAIFAGLILGTLAMRTRSIWGGVLIHVAVAFSMDYLALQNCPSADAYDNSHLRPAQMQCPSHG